MPSKAALAAEPDAGVEVMRPSAIASKATERTRPTTRLLAPNRPGVNAPPRAEATGSAMRSSGRLSSLCKQAHRSDRVVVWRVRWIMSDRTSRALITVLCGVLSLSAVALVVAWTTGSWSVQTTPSASVAQPVKVAGMPPAKITVGLNVGWTQVLPVLHADIARASGIAGLQGCAQNPPDMSSMPENPGFFCTATQGFNSNSLTVLERLPAVGDIGGSNARRHYESLYFLGVLRGEKALVMEPIGTNARIQADLAALRELPGVGHCGWEPGLGGPNGATIACAVGSRATLMHDQRAAKRLNVAYAEVITSW